MQKSRSKVWKFGAHLGVLLTFALIVSSCGGGEDADTEGLGVVEVSPGDAIQIRSLETISGNTSYLGLPNYHGAQMAVNDYLAAQEDGMLHGFNVNLGQGLDEFCSAEGGQAAAQTIVADESIVGVIGTSCSGAAVAAAPLITNAGMAMISASNTSPSLTSNLQGEANENRNVGYYRTAHNDLFQGAAVAQFVFEELNLTRAAAIHDGDPYSAGLAIAFQDAFENLGGTLVQLTAINKEDIDMVPALTEVAAEEPEAIFFPVFQPAGDYIVKQVSSVAGLEDAVLIGADAILVDAFMGLPESAGVYLAGPDTQYGDNTNASTGKTAKEVLSEYEDTYGEAPSAAFWAHAYDATTLLLDAIKEASSKEGDALVIDRSKVREYLDSVANFKGLTGTLSCDEFGDCGASKISIIQNLGGEDQVTASKENVVFTTP